MALEQLSPEQYREFLRELKEEADAEERHKEASRRYLDGKRRESEERGGRSWPL